MKCLAPYEYGDLENPHKKDVCSLYPMIKYLQVTCFYLQSKKLMAMQTRQKELSKWPATFPFHCIFSGNLFIPALNVGSSSIETTAASTASTALPPASRAFHPAYAAFLIPVS